MKHPIKNLFGRSAGPSDWIALCQDAGLWFNEPIVMQYDRDSHRVEWVCTNERIVEIPFVLQSLGRIKGSSYFSILEVGSCESLMAYQLASLNYHVTATDLRPLPMQHPNLRFVQGDFLKLDLEPGAFDCVIALSTVEHIGLGWYGDERGADFDRLAMRKIYELIRRDGYLLLTVPFGQKIQTPLHRIYDSPGLAELIEKFEVIDRKFGIRLSRFDWSVTDDEQEAAQKDHNAVPGFPGAVAMLVCRRP